MSVKVSTPRTPSPPAAATAHAIRDGIVDVDSRFRRRWAARPGGRDTPRPVRRGYALLLQRRRFVAGKSGLRLSSLEIRATSGSDARGRWLRAGRESRRDGRRALAADAEKLVAAAHRLPYSNATRGNIDVGLEVTVLSGSCRQRSSSDRRHQSPRRLPCPLRRVNYSQDACFPRGLRADRSTTREIATPQPAPARSGVVSGLTVSLTGGTSRPAITSSRASDRPTARLELDAERSVSVASGARIPGRAAYVSGRGTGPVARHRLRLGRDGLRAHRGRCELVLVPHARAAARRGGAVARPTSVGSTWRRDRAFKSGGGRAEQAPRS